jgi:DNA-binding transcriptional MerR regulator
MEALRQVRLRGKPMWIPDASTDSEFSQAQVVFGEPIRGWLAFPILSSEGVIGVVQFVSSETRQPDPKLPRILEGFGRLFGQLLKDVEAPDLRLVDETETIRTGIPNPSPQTVPDAFRDLAGAVRAASQALERHPTLPHVERTPVLGELTAGIGKLNRLLEHAIRSNADGPPTSASPAASTEVSAALPTGLTLKAVSRRTGIPAATLRTWEHRYGFMRPRRSPSGHRLYGEAEIARIEKVKYLVEQGVRIGAAMKAVIEEAAGDGLADESKQADDQSQSREDGKYAEVYRLDPGSTRGRRP